MKALGAKCGTFFGVKPNRVEANKAPNQMEAYIIIASNLGLVEVTLNYTAFDKNKFLQILMV